MDIETEISCIPSFQSKRSQTKKEKEDVAWYCIDKLYQTKSAGFSLTASQMQFTYLWRKNIHILRTIKWKLGMKIWNIYCSPCRCVRVQLKNYHNLTYGACDIYAWAAVHSIHFSSASILGKEQDVWTTWQRWMSSSGFTHETLHPSGLWCLVTNISKQYRDAQTQTQG